MREPEEIAVDADLDPEAFVRALLDKVRSSVHEVRHSFPNDPVLIFTQLDGENFTGDVHIHSLQRKDLEKIEQKYLVDGRGLVKKIGEAVYACPSDCFSVLVLLRFESDTEFYVHFMPKVEVTKITLNAPGGSA